MTTDVAALGTLDRAELEARVTSILAEAKRAGADAAEVSASEDAGLSLSVRLGDIETLEFTKDRGFGITVYFGHRKGSASTSDATPAAIAETVEAACNIARFTEEDPYNGLADASLMARDVPDLELHHPWHVSVDDVQTIALECESAARALDKRIVNSEGASVNSHQGCRVYGNSHGFLGSFVSSRHSVSCSVIAADEKGMQRDYWYTLAREPSALQGAEEVGREAARRSVARLGARRVPTGRYPVLFSPQMAMGLIGSLLAALSGGQLYRKASFLTDSLGRTILPSGYSVLERPRLKRALASAAFDADGVATYDKAIVSNGVVASYLLGSYSARRLGLTTTANAGGTHNILLEGDAVSPDALLARAGRGLLVTEMMGQGVNLVTGDYSRGVAGFWIEGGAIAHPVEETTIAGNLKDMLAGIAGIGTDVDLRGGIRTGSILIDAMTVAAG
jgi:PmbA protein